jgi:hypothetical protein
MTVPAQPIEVLLIEDDAGDELMTREAFEDNKIDNRLHVVRDGEEALDFLYQRGGHAPNAIDNPGDGHPPYQVRRRCRWCWRCLRGRGCGAG